MIRKYLLLSAIGATLAAALASPAMALNPQPLPPIESGIPAWTSHTVVTHHAR